MDMNEVREKHVYLSVQSECHKNIKIISDSVALRIIRARNSPHFFICLLFLDNFQN